MSKRADVLLFEKGLVGSREKAKRIIMTGAVYVDEVKIDKPGEQIDEEANIIIRENPVHYVSRGGLKLEKAVTEFKVDVDGKIAVDIGASTGGFSDYMLQNGLKKVYAIDVGYGQLDYKLREDDRVVVMERTNVRYTTREDIGEIVDLITIDVSFISLELILPVAKELLKEDGSIIALIKPQFEAGRSRVGKNGLVRDKKVHRDVLEKINGICDELGLKIANLDYSPITGTKGNIEFISEIVFKDNLEKNESIDIDKTVDTAHLEL